MPYQIDRTRCLCCHNCEMECPVGAIGYQGTGYVIDQDKCIECGHCAAVCNVEAATQVGATISAEPHETRELEAALVVLGAGASGVVAALRGAESGQPVILLEKAAKIGGSGWFAGFMAPEEGKPAPVPPMFLETKQTLLDGGIDPEVIAVAQNTMGEFYQWFRKQDPRVDQLWTLVPGPGGMCYDLAQRTYFNTKNRDRAIGPGRSTSVMESILADHFQEKGVQLLTRHEALTIETDEAGNVCGVMAKDPGGLVHIRCKAVVCCTGGFVHNPDMMRRYAPQFFGAEGEEPTHCFAAPTNTGDVVRLGESAGAYLDRENFFANVFGPVHHPFHFTLFHFANQGEVMTVNLHGERFMDESRMGAGAAAMAHQPGRVAWSILDADTKAYLCKAAETGRDAKDLVGYQEDFEVEEQLDTPLKKADTLEELAQLCGIDGENLKKTVEHYNALCQAGEDVDFGKRPETMRPVVKAPFYAIYGKMATDGAFGGMLVNGRMEVYRADHSGVIGGLYACGDNASGWCLRSKEEGDHRLMASNECNWAISSGFVAGGQAAEWVK